MMCSISRHIRGLLSSRIASLFVLKARRSLCIN